MAYTKQQREENAKKNANELDSKVDEKVEAKTNPVKQTKKVIKLEDSILITVKSNVFGKLTFKNHKTGDVTKWLEFGDTQELSIGDLRSMKGTQRRFFSDNWIIIEGVYDDGYEDVTPEDIYKTLQVSQYYEELLCPKNINDVFNWSIKDIESKVPNMSAGVKESLIIKANELIEKDVLDSRNKIKSLEKALKCELTIDGK